MNAIAWTILGTVITVAGTIIVAVLTGRSARRTAETNAAAGAWSQVLPIWKGTIEQLQATQAAQATQIADLQQKDRINVAWKQAALAHILALHTYVRMHLHRDDIPTVPTELAEDILPFTAAPPN